MKKEDKLSFIIPCYNSEKYLDKLMNSVINQTYKNIEIVCINDGSKDNTLKILKEYAKKYSNIVVIDKKNEGQHKARKEGVFKATGKYIGFLDSDDYVEPTYAEKLYKTLIDNDADISVCGYNKIDSKTGKLIKSEMCKPRKEVIYPQENPGLLLEINTAIWNKLFKAELIKDSYTFETAKVYEDMILLQYIYPNTKKIAFVKEPLYNYMIISGSTINSTKKESIIELRNSLKNVRDKYKKDKVSENFLNYCDANAFVHLGISIPFRILNDKTANFSKEVREITEFLDKNNPFWRNNKYIKLNWVIKNKGANSKLFIVHKIYKLHLFKTFIKFYNFIINKFGIDIKW